MLEVSLDAAAYVEHVRRRLELPATAGLRFWVDPTGVEEPFQVGFAAAPDAEDDVIERDGARVFVAPELALVFMTHALDVDAHSPPNLVLRSQWERR
jgi:Fe-S cluster assembly iron-binding protein IscA